MLKLLPSLLVISLLHFTSGSSSTGSKPKWRQLKEVKVLSRQRRSLEFPKGSGYQIKWGIKFPMTGFDAFKGSFQFTLPVKIPFSSAYPEKALKEELKSRTDEWWSNSDYYDNDPKSSYSEYRNFQNFHQYRALDFPEYLDFQNLYNNKSQLFRINNGVSQGFLSDVENDVTSADVMNVQLWHKWNSRRERKQFYEVLEKFMYTVGVPGRECLLRTICEVAEDPFEGTLMGELFNIIMTPSLSGDTALDDSMYSEFLWAEKVGVAHQSCQEEFNSCQESFFVKLLELVYALL